MPVVTGTLMSTNKLQKGKIHPITGHENPEVEYRYSPTLSLTSTQYEGGWSTLRTGRFTPRKDPILIV